MKLKAMYTCVTRHPDSDGAYEANDEKTYQTKKLHKTSKRSMHWPKWQQSKTAKTPPKTPPKDPYMIEAPPPPPTTPPPPIPVEQPPPAPKRNSPRTKKLTSSETSALSSQAGLDNEVSSGCILPNKHVDTSIPFVISDTEMSIQRENCDWTSAFDNKAVSFGNENTNSTKSSPIFGTATTDDLNSSQDEVFSRMSPTWPLAGKNSWSNGFTECVGDSDDDTINLLQAMKISSLDQQENGKRPELQSTEDDIEDLRNKVIKEYFNNNTITTENAIGVRTGSASSLSSSSSNSLITSVDRATASFDTVRAIYDEQRATRAGSFDPRRRLNTAGKMQRNNCTATPAPSSRRAFSTSVANKNVNWSDIPPLVPPREPVRPSRSVPRHLSTPSPTSPPRLTSASSATTFSSSARFESERSKRDARSSTTAVFSALPLSMIGSSPVILPIMKDGKQESFTHYYLLEDEECAPKSQRPPRPTPEPLIGIARPTPSATATPFNRSSGPAPPRPPPPSGSLLNSSPDSNATSNTDRSSTLPPHSIVSSHPASTYPPRRSPPSIGGSFHSSCNDATRSVPRYCDMGPGQKVVALQSEVFGVTDEECQSALRLNKWDVIKSIKYLMVEQLFRVGISTWEDCHRILQATKWDLQSASRVLMEQHRSNRAASS